MKTFRSVGMCLLVMSSFAVSAQVYQPETCKNAFTREQEMDEGAKVVAEVYKQMPVLPDSDPAARYVQQIGQRLVAAAPMTPGLQQPWPFRFHVVANSEINAFALPGGTMFVNLGAIQAAETEAQLAGVMGHEMSHVILRHSTCNITAQRKKSILYGLGALGSAILLGDSTLGAVAQKGIAVGQGLDFLHMSRGDEQQADLLGAQIVYNAGYDPRGLPQFFEIIQTKVGSGGAQFLSDHPNPGNREAYINAEIAALPRLEHPVVNTEGFKQMRARAAGLPTYDGKQIQAGGWRSTGLYSAAPEAGPSRSAGPVAGSPLRVPTIAPLSAAQIGLNDALRRYQATQWSMPIPRSWTATAGNNGDVTMAPAGGAGAFGVAYGVFGGVRRQSGQGLSDAASLTEATRAFAQTLMQQNALTSNGQMTSLKIGGQVAMMMDLAGLSPVAVSGAQLPEHDVLVTIARTDGDMTFFVFV